LGAYGFNFGVMKKQFVPISYQKKIYILFGIRPIVSKNQKIMNRKADTTNQKKPRKRKTYDNVKGEKTAEPTDQKKPTKSKRPECGVDGCKKAKNNQISIRKA
jgi:hypothetical protein